MRRIQVVLCGLRTPVPLPSLTHTGVKCDYCGCGDRGKKPFIGTRWHCIVNDMDACDECFSFIDHSSPQIWIKIRCPVVDTDSMDRQLSRVVMC
jgi:hypothetical protein